MDAHKAEILCKWFLRFNGYFTIDNFIVHDPARVSMGTIGNVTETDLLGVRHQFSREIAGGMQIQNDPILIDTNNINIDFIIGEVKTGNSDKPNSVWRNQNIAAISYLIRFGGIIEQETDIVTIATAVASHGVYTDPNNRFRIRLVLLFENSPNKNWTHILHISLDHIIDFLLAPRGSCWVEAGLGKNSIHHQWDPLINQIFEIANDQNRIIEDRKIAIVALLN